MAGNDAFTKVLLHMDGTNGSTSFPDECAGTLPHTWTPAGNAKISTVQSKFGGASALFDGNGDKITTPDSADFTLGSGDFTVDFFAYNSGGTHGGTNAFLFGQGNTTGTGNFSIIGYQDGSAHFVAAASADGTALTTVTSTNVYSATGFNHVAFVRTGNTLKLFINGTQEGGDISFSGSVNDSSSVWGVATIGDSTTGTVWWNGFIDEFRLSVGVARFTANFTPPAAPYDTGIHVPYPQLAPLLAQ